MLDLQELDAAALARWCDAGLVTLRAHREEIDALDAYPVPDRDTGTNLLLTWESVRSALGERLAGTGLASTVEAMAHGALLGARGNSGLIVSQLLRGMAATFAPLASAGGAQLAAALVRAAESAYAAVGAPVEGTVLSVARAAGAAASAAASALAATPAQLGVLARAGVVDAGGRGLVLLLVALRPVVTGEPLTGPAPAPLVAHAGLVGERESGGDLAYEVQLLLDTDPMGEQQAVAALRVALSAFGDSLVVVGAAPTSPGLCSVHVHVDDVGAAVEAAIAAGRPHGIRVTRFADAPHMGGGQPAPSALSGRAVVAVVAGAGLAAQLRSAATPDGLQVVLVPSAAGTGPSAADLLAAEVVGRLLASGGELVTISTGAGLAVDDAGRLPELLLAAHPGVEVVLLDGGQPLHPLLLAVE